MLEDIKSMTSEKYKEYLGAEMPALFDYYYDIALSIILKFYTCIDINNLTDEEKKVLIKALCIQIKYLIDNDLDANGFTTSFSIGDYSESRQLTNSNGKINELSTNADNLLRTVFNCGGSARWVYTKQPCCCIGGNGEDNNG